MKQNTDIPSARSGLWKRCWRFVKNAHLPEFFLYAIVLPCFALQVSVVAGIFLLLGDMSVTGIGCTYDPAGFVLLALFALIAIAVFSALLLLLLKVNSSKTSRYREDNPRCSYRRIAGVLLFLLMAGVSHSSTTAPEHREGIILPQKSWLEETAIPVYLSIFDSRTGRITLLLINLATFGVMRRKLCLKSDTPEAALELLATRRPFTVRTLVAMLWLFPVWPAVLAAIHYHRLQKIRLLRRHYPCPNCMGRKIHSLPLPVGEENLPLLTDGERLELKLKTAYILVCECPDCGERFKLRMPLTKEGYELCPECLHLTLHRTEDYHVVKPATGSGEGLHEARHQCRFCGAEYMVGYPMPKTSV